MIRVQKKTLERVPVINNSLQLNEYRSTIIDEYVSHLPLYIEDSNHGINSLGGLSQVKYQLSKDVLHMQDSFDHSLVS